MINPENFILTSDFATLKIDGASQSLTCTIPGSTAIASGGTFQVTSERDVGGANSTFRSRCYGSKDSSSDLVANVRVFRRTGIIGGAPSQYDIKTWISRVSATTIRLTVRIENIYGVAMTTEVGDEDIVYTLTTFKSPFS